MKLIIFLSVLMFTFTSYNDSHYEVKIDSNTTKKELAEKIKNAEKHGLLINLPYATYQDNNKVSVLQIKAEVKEVGKGSATYDFKNENTCVIVFKDLRKGAKAAFGFRTCEEK